MFLILIRFEYIIMYCLNNIEKIFLYMFWFYFEIEKKLIFLGLLIFDELK